MVKLAYVETPFPQEKIEVRRGEGVYTGWVKQFFFSREERFKHE